MAFIGKGLAAIGVLLAGLSWVSPASAQVPRTWVSPLGNDNSPFCLRLLPCRTFAGALPKTAPGGQINCVDGGGYGAVTIDKAVSIVCDEVDADVMVSGSNAITVQAGPDDAVFISGVDLTGVGGLGYIGVQYLSGGSLHLRNMKIRGFNTHGVDFYSGSPAMSLYMEDVYVTGNGTPGATTTAGIRVLPFPGGAANVSMERVTIADNRNVGMRAETTGITDGKVTIVMSNSRIANNGTGLLIKAPAGTGTVRVQVAGTVISQNTGFGLAANGTGSQMGVRNSEIVFNGTGIFAGQASQILNDGNNLLRGNSTNGTWSP